jgi:histidinol-phosphate phosphatase family protein
MESRIQFRRRRGTDRDRGSLVQAVIMAGGKGTRLRALTGDRMPKSMVALLGKPILRHQVEALKKNGISDIVLVIGHLGGVIKDYFGNGSRFGVSIEYIVEDVPLGTAGSLCYVKEKLRADNFILLFGDVIFDIDIGRMVRFHDAHKAFATLFVHPNSHPYDSDLILTDADDRVIKLDSKHNVREYWYDNCVNAGFYVLHKSVCDRVAAGEKADLEKDVFSEMIAEKAAIYAYRSPEYIKDAGTEDRIEEVCAHLESGFVRARNLQNKQRCIFMDRDGTINVHKGLVYREEDFCFEPGAVEAIKRINDAGLLAVVATNQPVVARGLCAIEDVENIHNKMKTLLGKSGAFLDRVVFCPHHPDKGYPEENPAYKIPCDCRKPNTGMFDACTADFNIDTENSWMIGDSTTDIQSGKNAGLNTALVLTGEAGRDGKYNVCADLVCENLSDAVCKILEGGAHQK